MNGKSIKGFKPCPFCGSKELYYNRTVTGQGSTDPIITCECEAQMVGVWLDKKQLMLKWNKRKSDEDIEQLRKNIKESAVANKKMILDGCDNRIEIEQLKKENEWLMRQYLYQIGYGSAKTEREAKEKLKEVMQQALKGG